MSAPARSISELIAFAYDQWRDRPFIATLENGSYQSLTYKDVIEQAYGIAQSLTDNGVVRQHIAIFAHNSAAWASMDYAIALSNNIAVLMDASWQVNEASHAITLTSPRLLYYDASTAPVVRELRKQFPHIIYRSLEQMPPIARSFAIKPARRQPDELAKILFSSGTTSQPKAIMLSEANMLFGWSELSQRMNNVDHRDRCYVFLPFHHVYANVVILLYALPIGCQLYLYSDMHNMRHEMSLARPTIIHGVPLFYEKIYDAIPEALRQRAERAAKLARTLHLPQAVRRKLFRSLYEALGGDIRYLLSGGAELAASLHQFFQDMGLFIYNAYGATETTGGISAMERGCREHDSVGVIYKDVNIKIIEPDAAGIGEILVKGPNVLMGYYSSKGGQQQAVDADGYYHTGDIGRLDEQRHLFITGRKTRRITLSNGENVWPDRIEEALSKIPGVARCRVYQHDGALHADVYTHSAPTSALKKACREASARLPKYSCVTRFTFSQHNPAATLVKHK